MMKPALWQEKQSDDDQAVQNLVAAANT